MTFKGHWEQNLGSVHIPLDVHRSLLKRLSSGETIVLYFQSLGGDRLSPWLNELHTQFVYVLCLSSNDLGFTTTNFLHGMKAMLEAIVESYALKF